MKFVVAAVFLILISPCLVFGNEAGDNLKKKLKDLPPDTNKVNTLVDLAWEYKSSDKETALKYSMEALALSEKLNFQRGKAYAYNDIGYIYLYSGDISNSVKYFIKELEINENIQDKKRIANSYMCIGSAYIFNEQFPQALSYMLKALELTKAINAQRRLAPIYGNLGLIYTELFEFDKALAYYLDALSIAYELNIPTSIGPNLNNIADVYFKKKDFSNALKYGQKALITNEENEDKYLVSGSKAIIGKVYCEQKKYSPGIKYLEESLKLANEIGVRDMEKVCYMNLSKANKELGNFKEALKYHELFMTVKDSMINSESREQIAEMQTRYETEKKEKENQLLRQQNKINELAVLSEQKQKANQRILFLGGSLIFLGMGGIIIRRKKIKQKQILKERVQKERERISRDLHDNIGSQLSYIISNVSYTLEDQAEVKNERLLAVEKEARNTIQNLRDTIWAIHNENISVKDFALRLEKYVLQQLEFIPNTKLEFINESSDANLSPEEALNLFRIAQEAINNSIKYSNAEKLTVKISGESKRILVHVEDNGKGFDISSVDTNNHYGLKNIQYRTESINGIFSINSEVNKGTIISVYLN